MTFVRAEGIVPAPEVTHAIKATVDLALEAREVGKEKVILFDLCGHGHFSLVAYEAYPASKLMDLEHSEEEIDLAEERIPDQVAIRLSTCPACSIASAWMPLDDGEVGRRAGGTPYVQLRSFCR